MSPPHQTVAERLDLAILWAPPASPVASSMPAHSSDILRTKHCEVSHGYNPSPAFRSDLDISERELPMNYVGHGAKPRTPTGD